MSATSAVGARARRLGTAFAVLCAAGLLGPSVDRDVLVAQGVARLLRDAAPGTGAAVGMLDAVEAAVASSAGLPLAWRVRVDGDVDVPPGIERVVGAALAGRFDTAQSAAGLGSDEAGSDAKLLLEVDVDTRRDRVAVSGRLGRLGSTGDSGTHWTALPAPSPWVLPGRAALLPPLVAVGVALLWQRTLLALFLGIAAGAIHRAAVAGSGWLAPVQGLWDVFAVYLRRELGDSFRIEIIGFIVALLAMTGVMSRAGGMRGLVDRALGFARSVRAVLALTWGMGLLIFFDDYANCMLVGSTFRPLTDRLRVSREKLAYVVDSTAAPVAGVSLFSTWIAFQVSVYSAQLPAVGITESAYWIFLQTLPYRFYCWLSLLFVLAVVWSGRDFGPMARAEARARLTGALVRVGGRPPISDALARMQPASGMQPDARRAWLPLLVTFAVTAVRIFTDGGGLARVASDPRSLLRFEVWTDVLFEGSGAGPIFGGAVAGLACAVFLAGSRPMRWGVAAGVAAALAGNLGPAISGKPGPGLWLTSVGVAVSFALAALATRRSSAVEPRPHLSGREIGRAAAASGPTLGFASVLLFEAWMIGAVCADIGTADYLVARLSGSLAPDLLPVLLFVVGALVAFSTGSSWSTMSILLPNAVPLAAVLGAASPLGVHGMVVLSISAVLEGAIFGDHCSPISDTTVLSSVASGSDHLDHVRTQAPYAATVAVAAVLGGYLPLLWWPERGPGLALAAGAALMLAVLFALGRRTPEAPDPRLAQV